MIETRVNRRKKDVVQTWTRNATFVKPSLGDDG